MNYEASDWVMGDLALVYSPRTEPTVRMLIIRRTGADADRRLWWGPLGYVEEDRITDIERVTALTMQQLNQRVEVNP